MMGIRKIILALGVLVAGCGESENPLPAKFLLNEYFIHEGTSAHTVQFTVIADEKVPENGTVSYFTREVEARFDTDLLPASGSLNFNKGKEAILSVEILGDQFLELQESFDIVILFNDTQHILNVTILDDDEIEPVLTDENGFLSSAEHPSMQQVWSDEFNGSQLNPDFWTYELGNGCSVGICGWGNNELQSYTNSVNNITVQNGALTIIARETSGSYSSARIKTQTKKPFRFGRMDVRAKLPKGKGIWPAIWMLGENITSIGWPACGEIDIMELVGHQPQTVHGTLHYNSGGYSTTSGSKSLTQGDFSDQYHVFTLVWDFNSIAWYVDHEKFKTFTRPSLGEYPFNNQFFFILNVAVGGNWPGNPDNTTVFPQEMQVDYIRVFQ